MAEVTSYLYIYHVDKEVELPVVPESFSSNMPVSFSPTSIPLASAPIYTFSNAGPRSVSITLKLHRGLFEIDTFGDFLDDLSLGNSREIERRRQSRERQNLDRMEEFINILSSLSLPNYRDADKLVIPPTVFYRAGNEVAIKGVVASNVTVTGEGAWLPNGKYSQVGVSFTISEVQPYSAEYVLKHGMMRGISSELQRTSVWQYRNR